MADKKKPEKVVKKEPKKPLPWKEEPYQDIMPETGEEKID